MTTDAKSVPVPEATARTAPRRTQAERSELSRRRLLDAAFELLAERRSVRFTLQDVGERAGYSRGLPSQVFGSKDGLLRDLVQHLNTISLDMPELKLDRGGFAAIVSILSGILSVSEAQKKISISLSVLMAEATRLDSPVREGMQALARLGAGYFARHLELAIEAGEIRGDIKPKAMGFVLSVGAQAIVRQWLVDPEEHLMADLRNEMLRMTIGDLAREPNRWLEPLGLSPAAAPVRSARRRG